ncbi:MAG: flagellar hook-basal body protein FliE [Paracoccus denitrificans]|nr:MAG: flagellar hook-basal body protein FliE [Paracoccus denitrificans]PZO83981.1 MAG: flagellar hook-basal body protein FliE [Paracoccus denitrificans]
MTTIASAYVSARSAIAPVSGGSALPQGITSAAQEFAQVMAQSDVAAQAAMTGTGDTQTLVQSIAQAQFAVETAAAIRDKVVEAYQEILRMPV